MISVIIPFFNADNYLADIIKDLMLQTYANMEIILIDDGSTDKSASIAQSYQLQDKRIRYIKIDHQGVSTARNIGLKIAQGQFIRFIDADDRIDDDSTEKMIFSMESDKDIDLVCGRFETSISNISYFGPRNVVGKTSIEEFIKDFGFAPKTFYYGVVWNKLYKKELIAEHSIRFDENLDWCEDFLFNLKYYEYCRNVYYLNDTIYKYIVREDGLNSYLSERIGSERINSIELYRYKKVEELYNKLGCSSAEFEDTWAYLALTEDLVNIASVFSNRSVRYRKNRDILLRFHDFKEILKVQDNRELLKRRNTEDSDVMIKIICKNVKRGNYIFLFIFMVIKDFMSVHCTTLRNIWRKRKKRGGTL